MKYPFSSLFKSRLGKVKTREPEQRCLPHDVSWKHTIPYIPPVSKGRVIKVYDGDTITIATHVHDMPEIYRFSVRLDGIDCPEMRTKNSVEKAVARLAKEHLEKRIMGRDVDLTGVSMDKYGRLLAEVWYNGNSMNKSLLDARLAVEYDGGKKHVPDNWIDYHMK